jgi:hypothetical protein
MDMELGEGLGGVSSEESAEQREVREILGLLERRRRSLGVQFARWQIGPPPPPQLAQRLRRLPWHGLGRVALFIGFFATCYSVMISVAHSGVVIALWMIPLGLRNAFHWRTPESVRELMDFPSTDMQFPVRVSLKSRGQKVGTDQGVVTFVDDLLHFEGLKVSFDLPSRLLTYQTSGTKRSRINSKTEQGPHQLNWMYRDAGGSIEIRPYQTIRGVQKKLSESFKIALTVWSNAASQPHDVVSLPPVTTRNDQESDATR